MPDLPRDSRAVDLLVIGGGIFGAGVAREAALLGNRVALLEKGDLAQGTSSQSTKLLHGGLRYLEHGQFSLVRESLRERAVQAELAPHLASPLPFLVPLGEASRLRPWKLKLGLWLYDWLAGRPAGFRPGFLSPGELATAAPTLAQQGSRGAGGYLHWETYDSRLVVECALQAAQHGAQVATRTEVVDIQGGPPDLFRVRAQTTGARGTEVQEWTARCIVATTGPWTDRFRSRTWPEAAPRSRLTSGVHIVVPKIDPKQAWLLTAPSDGRVFFVIPFFGQTLIGTTDRDFEGDPDRTQVESTDVAYLLSATNAYLQDRRLTESDVISSFIGLRALVRSGKGHPSHASREKCIFESPAGVWHIVGGKLTTWRLIAHEILRRAAAGGALRLDAGERSRHTPLPGGCFGPSSDRGLAARELARHGRLEMEIATHLECRYGSRAAEVAEIARDHPQLGTPLLPGWLETPAEMLYTRRFEFAETLEDFLRRRTPLALTTKISAAERSRLERIWAELRV